MPQQGEHAAVAVIGLVMLADEKTIIDLGTVARAFRRADGSVQLELAVTTTHSCFQELKGEDAKAIWGILASAANKTRDLQPLPTVQDILAGASMVTRSSPLDSPMPTPDEPLRPRVY